MFLLILTALPVIVYFYIKWKLNHWQRKGVYTKEGKFPEGSMGDVKKGKLRSHEFFQNFYKDIKGRGLKYGGLYNGLQAVLVPVDQELIKNIMLKDFQHFVDHGLYSNPKVDPLSGGLFLMEGEPWRNHRTKLTPTFTSGKMKMMFNTLVVHTKGLEKLLEKEFSTGEPVFIKETLARFTTDIIGSVAFGIDCNCMNEPNNEFRRNCTKAFGISGKLKLFLYQHFPKWALKAINFKQGDPQVEEFFFNLVESTIKYREENKVTRKDFLQMLIELKNTGSVSEGETIGQATQAAATPFFEVRDIVSHSFTFFLAGFETSSTTMSFAIVELSHNQDIQEKLREEILTVLAKYNGEITYEGIGEMTYLDQVLQETLRKYPPIPVIPRVCTKTYKVPGEDLVIDEGTIVQICAKAIHSDPEFYPNPEEFDPDRWTPENSRDRSNFHFLSFGEGPRLCIGARFGKLQAKCGIITLLKNYKVTLSDKMKYPVKMTAHFIVSVDGGVWVNLEKLKSK